jgi:hypothetical protein
MFDLVFALGHRVACGREQFGASVLGAKWEVAREVGKIVKTSGNVENDELTIGVWTKRLHAVARGV